MTFNFDARKSSRQEAAREMDSLQRDRFELLSAFIDGEVTAAERRQVEELLASDPQMQQLHSRLLLLRQGLQKMPIPAPEATAQEKAQDIFSRIDRRRTRRAILWGGAAIAAVFVSVLSGIVSGNRTFAPKLAQSPRHQEPLMIAVNRPLIDLPKAAVASPDNLIEPPAVNNDIQKNNFN